MNEFTLKLPNAKTFDALEEIVKSHPDPSVRQLAMTTVTLADALMVLNKVVAAAGIGVRITRDTDSESREP